MSERDELLNVLLDADEAHKAEGAMWPELADAILAAGYRKTQQVTTVEELDALPVGSAVVDWKGSIYEKDAEDEAPDLPWWMTTGDQRRYPAKRIALPATVLHVGGAE